MKRLFHLKDYQRKIDLIYWILRSHFQEADEFLSHPYFNDLYWPYYKTTRKLLKSCDVIQLERYWKKIQSELKNQKWEVV